MTINCGDVVTKADLLCRSHQSCMGERIAHTQSRAGTKEEQTPKSEGPNPCRNKPTVAPGAM
jgi:hypothetical protein